MKKTAGLLATVLIVTCVLCNNLILMGKNAFVPVDSALAPYGLSVELQEDGVILIKDGELELKAAVDSKKVDVHDKQYALESEPVKKWGKVYIAPNDVKLVQAISLYDRSVIDASEAQADEVFPLVTIAQDAERVLVGTWHRYPDSYVTGTEGTAAYGEIWVFTQDEILNFARENDLGDDLELRFQQLIGLPPEAGYTHFSFIWVSPEDLVRPAFNTDIHVDAMPLELTADEAFTEWFLGNAEYSYTNHRYPWTRLGYTYDWADNGKEYGLTEFLLKEGSAYQVEKTYNNQEFFSLVLSLQSENQTGRLAS